MSKYVKDLMVKELAQRLEGVTDALVVNVVGMEANQTVALRKQLRDRNIHLLVVKTSLVRRATEGTPLAAAFDGMEGPLAVMWGAEDMVSLAKEGIRLHKSQEVAAFAARGGVMEGESLTAQRVDEISKWPSREEQLSILMGQVLGAGAGLLAAILGPGAMLANQIKQIGEKEEGSES